MRRTKSICSSVAVTASPPASVDDTYTDQNCPVTPPAKARYVGVQRRHEFGEIDFVEVVPAQHAHGPSQVVVPIDHSPDARPVHRTVLLKPAKRGRTAWVVWCPIPSAGRAAIATDTPICPYYYSSVVFRHRYLLLLTSHLEEQLTHRLE